MRALDELAVKYYLKAMAAVDKYMSEERGDTNFISILIVLGIVVVLAGVFMTFGKDIKTAVETATSTFLANFKAFK